MIFCRNCLVTYNLISHIRANPNFCKKITMDPSMPKAVNKLSFYFLKYKKKYMLQVFLGNKNILIRRILVVVIKSLIIFF